MCTYAGYAAFYSKDIFRFLYQIFIDHDTNVFEIKFA